MNDRINTLRRESLRYYRLLRGFHDEPADLEVTLRGIRQIKGQAPHNHYLHLDPEEGLFEVERVFAMAGKALIYTKSYLPDRLFEGLDALPASLFEKVTLYELLEDKYGVTTVFNQELFGTVDLEQRLGAGWQEIKRVAGVRFAGPAARQEYD